MFVSTAYAQAAGAPADAAAGLGAFLPLILIFVVFYFLLIRPQQKKMNEHKQMLTTIRRGDRIVTGGGIIGTVTKVVTDDELQVEIAEGTKVRVQRGMVSQVLSRTEPVKEAASNDTSGGAAGGGTAGGGAGGIAGGVSKLKALLGGGK